MEDLDLDSAPKEIKPELLKPENKPELLNRLEGR